MNLRLLMRLAARSALLLLVAVLCAAAWNAVGPRRIPWAQDWNQHVEARAADEGMPILRLADMDRAVAEATHIILDARPPEDYAVGHIPTALSMPFQDMDRALEELIFMFTPEIPLAGYCSGTECDEALMMLLEMRQLGFTNVWLFAEGFSVWKRSGRAVEVAP